MRDIRFRAWDKVGEQWIVNQIVMGRILSNSFPKTWELSEYTGLKDKNGKEIYEGDIVKCIDMHDGNLFAFINNKPILLEVRWSNEDASFVIGKYPEEYTIFQSLMSCFEVIGNIYENPELLKLSQ